MKGFDNRFKDFPDYILKITYQIWENKDIESIRDYYANNIPVRSPEGVIYGPDSVIKATRNTLNEFPDRKLLGEDVIWIGDEAHGYFSSHRILSKGTHTTDGVYGPASGKNIVYRVIADCACKNNQVYDEWLIRDQGAIVRQIGIDPKTYAANLIEKEGGVDKCTIPFNTSTTIESNYISPPLLQNNIGEHYANILISIMSGNKNIIKSHYNRSIQQEQPGGLKGHGLDDVTNFWNSIRLSFPDAKFNVEHISFTEETTQPKKAAIRWSMIGSHSGNGKFGMPSNAEVYIMGINHAEFGPRGIKNEWVLFDEAMIWKQILIQKG